MEKQWFESWFDTPYYHLLYKNRDDREAQNFLDLILGQIPIKQPASILDLACGKGRHAIYLAKKGFDVTGMDLSPANILAASKSSHEHLRFEIKDMRDDLGTERFNAVFNLFTGFGYFETDKENFQVFKNVKKSLKNNGYFLFDYLNAEYVRALNTDSSEFTVEGIGFKTKKEFKDRWVIKHIYVTDGEKEYTYSEQVALYSKDEIVHELENIGFKIIKEFGDYQLNKFNSASPRLILVGHKP